MTFGVLSKILVWSVVLVCFFQLPEEVSSEYVPLGIIGLDSSHGPAFTELLNEEKDEGLLAQYQVVAAFPQGSRSIVSSMERVPGHIEQVQNLGVEIVDSIAELLHKVDAVLLLSTDGGIHLEQVLPVLQAGKPVFVDKPVGGSLAEVVAIYDAADHYETPIFSSSALRYAEQTIAVSTGDIGEVIGADSYSPAMREPSHPDLFWYGIHGVEALFTVMGPGCASVVRREDDRGDVVICDWRDGRTGTFRGLRGEQRSFGGTAFGSNGIADFGSFDGYRGLVEAIVAFFAKDTPPISPEETIEIYAFMEAADESKRQGGRSVTLQSLFEGLQEYEETHEVKSIEVAIDHMWNAFNRGDEDDFRSHLTDQWQLRTARGANLIPADLFRTTEDGESKVDHADPVVHLTGPVAWVTYSASIRSKLPQMDDGPVDVTSVFKYQEGTWRSAHTSFARR